MGSFGNIARRSSPRNREFELGFELIDNKNTVSEFELLVTFSEQANSASPRIKKIHFVFGDGKIIFLDASTTSKNTNWEIKAEKQNSKKIFTISLKERLNYSFFHNLIGVIGCYANYDPDFDVKEARDSDERQFIKFIRAKNLDRFLSLYFGCFSFAPTRSEPRRTYEPLDDMPSSFGDEIPVRLRDLSIKKGEAWDKLYKSLKDFGIKSGLFTDIKVRKLGGSLSNPFQLELKIRKGAATNLIDVGYGVSQILPLLVRILIKQGHTFLMQQPEVHLHPQAQAAFTSLLATLAKQKNNTFIIETHSDYMVNRARIDIMEGNIKPEDVSLIYLEAKGKDVEVHNLCFDKQGNFKDDPPDGYDDFFLSESHKLLGWKD